MRLTHIAIFCGSKTGNHPAYLEAARATGALLAQQGIAIVYGGGHVGLMGAMADAALEHGGEVHGVIPQSLVDSEIAHAGLTQLHVVHTMHERKARMAELANAFIALPGGSGTLEEIFEQWTWGQLGIHEKPCGFLNTRGYYEPLRTFTQQMVDEGFTKQSYADMLVFSETLEDLLAHFRNYTAPPRKWIVPAGHIKP